MKPKRSRRILNLALYSGNLEERDCISPLPEGAEQNYQALRHILDDNDCEDPSTNNVVLSNVKSSQVQMPATTLTEPSVVHCLRSGSNKNTVIDPILNNAFETNIHSSQVLITYNEPNTSSQVHLEPTVSDDIMMPCTFANLNALPATPSTRSKLLPVTSTMQLSPFNIEITTSFNNSPIIRMESDENILDCINIPTPIPSPLNRHSSKNCNDVFCSEHEEWKDSYSKAGPQQRKLRKRQRNKAEWSDVKRKVRTNQGKAFVNRKGNVVEQKTMKPPCTCRNKCFEKISSTTRQSIFSKYWALSGKQKQWTFIIQYTTKNKKKRCLNVSEPNNRKYTYNYYFPFVSEDLKKIEVCKTMFINTLGVSGKTLVTAWNKYDGNIAVEDDRRGQHSNHKKVLVEEMVKSVCDHVRAFEPVESHYLREKTTKLFLDSTLSIARMFNMYKEWFDAEKYSVKAVTERQYRDIVNSNFNLGFFCPKKDQCDQCHSYRNLNVITQEQCDSFKEHQKRKKIARGLKHKNKDEAFLSEGLTLCAVFDFEKVLTCPFGQVSIFYYKKKLSCFNFTIYDMGQKRGVCYMWDETIAKRGANEVSSCLIDFIAVNVDKGVKNFVFWSDNCPGQNRNRYVYSSYIYASNKYKVSITHRFMEKGHTQNEGDSVHSTIENASRTRKIYTPNEWQLLVRWARNSTESPYIVKNMQQKDFYDFKQRLSEKVWTKNINGQKVAWNSIKEVYVDVNQPNKLQYKYDLSSEEYDIIIIASNTRNSQNVNLTRAYNKPINIPLDKYKDLISLCNTNVIPQEYHEYFKNLPHSLTNQVVDETEVT